VGEAAKHLQRLPQFAHRTLRPFGPKEAASSRYWVWQDGQVTIIGVDLAAGAGSATLLVE
jgi:hypothetical protein